MTLGTFVSCLSARSCFQSSLVLPRSDREAKRSRTAPSSSSSSGAATSEGVGHDLSVALDQHMAQQAPFPFFWHDDTPGRYPILQFVRLSTLSVLRQTFHDSWSDVDLATALFRGAEPVKVVTECMGRMTRRKGGDDELVPVTHDDDCDDCVGFEADGYVTYAAVLLSRSSTHREPARVRREPQNKAAARTLLSLESVYVERVLRPRVTVHLIPVLVSLVLMYYAPCKLSSYFAQEDDMVPICFLDWSPFSCASLSPVSPSYSATSPAYDPPVDDL